MARFIVVCVKRYKSICAIVRRIVFENKLLMMMRLASRYDNPICRNGPSGYIGWGNLFLGIYSWDP
jgi:hypothetical protein